MMPSVLSKISCIRCSRRYVCAGLVIAGALSASAWLAPDSYGMAAQNAASADNANGQQSSPTVSPETPYQKYLKERRDVEKYQRKQERKEEVRQSRADNPEAHDDVDQYRHSPMVQTVAHRLGLSTEIAARIFEWFNFLILLAAIVWFVARVLPSTLRSRKERIQSGIERARAVTEDANRRLALVEQRLSRLDDEIHAIQTQARQETAAEEQRLRAALEQEKQRIVMAAEKEVNAASMNAQRQLKNLAAELVIEHARRQIVVSAEADRSLVGAFVAELPSGRRGGGVN